MGRPKPKQKLVVRPTCSHSWANSGGSRAKESGEQMHKDGQAKSSPSGIRNDVNSIPLMSK